MIIFHENKVIYPAFIWSGKWQRLREQMRKFWVIMTSHSHNLYQVPFCDFGINEECFDGTYLESGEWNENVRRGWVDVQQRSHPCRWTPGRPWGCRPRRPRRCRTGSERLSLSPPPWIFDAMTVRNERFFLQTSLDSSIWRLPSWCCLMGSGMWSLGPL